LKLDYYTFIEQLEIARAEIIEINSMHSSICSSTLNNDTCIDSNDNHDVLLDINACNVSTTSCASCNDLKHEIDDLKQVCDDMSAKLVEYNEKSAPEFIPSFTCHKEKKTIKSSKTYYPSNPKPFFNPKRGVKKESLKLREEDFVCIFCGRTGHFDKFCFRRKRIKRRRIEYARNSYRDEVY
jgi:hypothetical protein